MSRQRPADTDLHPRPSDMAMSKYRNHREPRRNDFDDDGQQAPEPDYFSRRTPAAPVSSATPAVEAEVLWFNADKGYGFVKLEDGSNAFLHVSALQGAGHEAVQEATQLTVRTGQGAKGVQVTEVVSVREEGAPAGSRDRPLPAHVSPPASPDVESQGTVTFFNVDKGFGFIALESGGKDAFVHASALRRSGVEGLHEGQRVVVQLGQGPKGPEVRSLRLA